MKIGILTFHLGPNHGGYLQAWCLCEYLKSTGHDVEIINYKNARHHEDETFRPWIYRRPRKLYNAWIKERVFQKAYQKLALSEFTTNVSEVAWENYEIVVIGSDVVWDFSWKRLGKDPVYFGDFGRDYQGKRIAYAPSTGTVNEDDEIPAWVGRGLRNFDAISARDDTTAAIVNQACGLKAPIVVDPTWLDLEYCSEEVIREKILVVYAFEITESQRFAIISFARKRGLRIVAVGYYHSWVDRNDLKLGPLEWPDMMKRAEAVVAGTFHGTLYAIKTQARFITLFNERIKHRVRKALEISGLSHRMISDAEHLESLLDTPIDYCKAMALIEPFVQKSRRYLIESLVKPK